MSFTINLSASQDGKVLYDLKIGKDETISWEKEEIDFLFITIVDLLELDSMKPEGQLTCQLLNMALNKKQNGFVCQSHVSLFKPHYL